MLPGRLLVPYLLLFGGRRATLLRVFGFGRSVRLMLPIDERGHPLPFLPYVVIELLEERLSRDLTVLEFGAGFSTRFFMKRVGRVVSIEHDPAWVARLREQLDANVTLIPASRDSADTYCAYLETSQERFDFILIDGRHRVECFRRSLDHLTERGMIVLDDSNRERYAEIFPLAERA
ncbi:MAG: class I SAM-dependent methyltransferase, partial [Gemmatimonadota bacterium]